MPAEHGTIGSQLWESAIGAADKCSSGSQVNSSARVPVTTSGLMLKGNTSMMPSVQSVADGLSNATGNPLPAPVYVVRSYASGARPVYDLQVADSHEFVAAGVIVHNCVWAISELTQRPSGRASWSAESGQLPDRIG